MGASSAPELRGDLISSSSLDGKAVQRVHREGPPGPPFMTVGTDGETGFS